MVPSAEYTARSGAYTHHQSVNWPLTGPILVTFSVKIIMIMIHFGIRQNLLYVYHLNQGTWVN